MARAEVLRIRMEEGQRNRQGTDPVGLSGSLLGFWFWFLLRMKWGAMGGL